jgi:hypothetical protein
MISMEPVSLEPSIDFAGTCDLAIWCKLLHDKGWSGARIGRAIGKSEGYVNNLIRVVERASPSVMLRWRAEQGGMLDHACATDWLVAVCMLPHDRQDEELRRRIASRPTYDRPATEAPAEPADDVPRFRA